MKKLEERKHEEERGQAHLFFLYLSVFVGFCALIAYYRNIVRPWLLASAVKMYDASEGEL